WVFPHLVEGRDDGTLIRRDSGLKVTPVRVESMSKSKKNVVDPDDIIEHYGADTARWFMLSDSPPERDCVWTEAGIEGAWRFTQRLWRLVTGALDCLPPPERAIPDSLDADNRDLRRIVHRTIRDVGTDIEALRLNRAVAHIHALANAIAGVDLPRIAGAVYREALETLVRLTAPMMPHIAEELWARLGHADMLAEQAWPAFDPALIAEDRVTIAVQVGGKLRETIEIEKDADREAVEAAARASEKVARALGSRPVRKVIVVPNRIVNFVV
ncbi:MAG: class I tRNA ligase family protein, partial [Rhodothalassiaceae bacterium]